MHNGFTVPHRRPGDPKTQIQRLLGAAGCMDAPIAHLEMMMIFDKLLDQFRASG